MRLRPERRYNLPQLPHRLNNNLPINTNIVYELPASRVRQEPRKGFYDTLGAQIAPTWTQIDVLLPPWVWNQLFPANLLLLLNLVKAD